REGDHVALRSWRSLRENFWLLYRRHQSTALALPAGHHPELNTEKLPERFERSRPDRRMVELPPRDRWPGPLPLAPQGDGRGPDRPLLRVIEHDPVVRIKAPWRGRYIGRLSERRERSPYLILGERFAGLLRRRTQRPAVIED